MRIINVIDLVPLIAGGFAEANLTLPSSLSERITAFSEKESNPAAKSVFADMQKNLVCAAKNSVPICQDCGMAVVFADIGQEIFFEGGLFTEAVNRGVALGYENGYLRKSVVSDPLKRVNTLDNTPAVIHTNIVPGDRLTLTLCPKGFGSENMSRIKMFNPSASIDDIEDFVVSAVKEAGGRPCPPLVLGVGIGGDFEYCALLAKKALCRDVNKRNPDPYYEEIENELLKKVNALGIGPQGFGGDCTALACNIETFATHIAGLPVAVNTGCHVTRHKTIVF